MVVAELNSVRPTASHPLAGPGFGKRVAGDDIPLEEIDLAHLCARDVEVHFYVHHLAEGSAMGYKALAGVHPRYGQQAFRTSLRRLSVAGHLRWVREHIVDETGSMRWVTRTYWSSAAQSDAWWTRFIRVIKGRDVTAHYIEGKVDVSPRNEKAAVVVEEQGPVTEETMAEAAGEEPVESEHSTAYIVLTTLRIVDPRLALSGSECRALEPLAVEFMARGATAEQLRAALSDGLPASIGNPGGFVRNRLRSKMPPVAVGAVTPVSAPVPPPRAVPRARVDRVIEICGGCMTPETVTRLRSGLCEDCHEDLRREDEAEAARDAERQALLTEAARRSPAPDLPATFRPAGWDHGVRRIGG